MPERAPAHGHAIGNRATAALLLLYGVVALWGPEILGERLAPTSLIWPAGGIGLALVLLRGRAVWPLLALVASACSMVALEGSPLPVLVGSGLLDGAVAAFASVLAASLIWRLADVACFDRAGTFLLAMLVAVPIAAVIAAVPVALGVPAPGLITSYSHAGALETWHITAMGHATAVLALTPPIWLWAQRSQLRLPWWRVLELIVFATIAALLFALPEQALPRYLLVVVHLAIALRFPVKWAAAAVLLSSLVYLWEATSMLGGRPLEALHLFFLTEITFVAILNVTTYTTALLIGEIRERLSQLEGLAFELSEAEQRERRRIAQILHDNFQQLLVGARMALKRGSDGEERASTLIDQAIADARTLAVELHPPVLDDQGLAAALRWLASDFRAMYGIEVIVEADEQAEPEGREVSSFLYQATRELLMNVVKHAGTDTAWVRLRRLDDRVQVEVEDRGSGCDPDQFGRRSGEERHYGVFSIRQRVELLGGAFELAAREGCRITLTVPRATGSADE